MRKEPTKKEFQDELTSVRAGVMQTKRMVQQLAQRTSLLYKALDQRPEEPKRTVRNQHE
jgi:hypothetical protein